MVHISMASFTMVLPLLFLIIIVCPYAPVVSAARSPAAGGGTSSCTRLFSFGDSITDAGNAVSLAPTVLTLPFGKTFFGQPSGRFSDGRLIVDFIAEALRLPAFSPPYLVGKTAGDFRHGANFAVAGASALNQSFFRDLGLDLSLIPPYSLDVQLEWFKHVLQLLAPTEHEREDVMSSSLFLMGEVGANDYNHIFFQNRPFTAEIKPLVPKVIGQIESAVKVLMGLGAKTIVVPGTDATGCVPRFLAMFRSNHSSGDVYDTTGCLKWLNDFADEHNRALKRMLHRIAPRDDPTVTIIYGDYYGAMMEVIRNPVRHGFTKDGALMACCGDGGPYNSGSLFSCNTSSILCPDPAEYISWDGIHFTEASYRFMARGLLDGPYAEPPIMSKCIR